MVEAVAEKPVCAKCGSDVREGTTFCYNCGSPVGVPADEPIDHDKTLVMEPKAEAPEQSSENSLDGGDRVKKAAKERKKARVTSRQPVEYRWEPVSDLSYPLIWAVIVTLIVALAAGLMVFWK